MTEVLALLVLFDGVVARMDAAAVAADRTPVPHVFGRRSFSERPETPPQPPETWRRVAWVPGNAGAAGALLPPSQPGRNPRPLATLAELCTVYFEAADASSADILRDEKAQYRATRLLFDAWVAAAYAESGIRVAMVDLRWVDDKVVTAFGATLRGVFTVEAMIPDTALSEAGVETPARAEGTTEELDLQEEDETAPPFPAAAAAGLENVVLAGEQTVDGVVLTDGDRVLLVNQTAQPENGLWVVHAGAWTRTADVLEHNSHVYVEVGGDVAGDAGFRLTTADPIVIGTTPLVFVRVSP